MKKLILLLITIITISSCNKKSQPTPEQEYKDFSIDFYFYPPDSGGCRSYNYYIIDNDRFIAGGTIDIGGSQTACTNILKFEGIYCRVAKDDNMKFDIHYWQNSSIAGVHSRDSIMTYQFYEGRNIVPIKF